MNLLKRAGEIISFFGIQYLLGRRGSFPYGLLMKFNLVQISVMVVVSDIFQTILLLNFFSWIAPKMNRFKKKIYRLIFPGKSMVERPVVERFRWLKRTGNWGVLLVAAIPYGGGALTGSIVASTLKMDKFKSFLLIMSGSIISTLLYYFGFKGILGILGK